VITESPRHGYGLRVPHYAELLEHGAGASCVEAITENFLNRGGRARAVLDRVRQDSEIVLHGVSLSIGSTDPLDLDYLGAVRDLARSIEATWISDHLCFGSVEGHRAHDLWPLPFTEEALVHVVERTRRAQDVLRTRLLLENVSSYVEYRCSTIPEWDFMREVAERADALLLLDVNNVHVNAKNHGFSPESYLDALSPERVKQIHLAGHTDYGTHAIDDHGSAVPGPVWELYRHALRRFGPLVTIVEWDENIPELGVLRAESETARRLEREVCDESR
jgi:uncharacterized protein (UPF0276 family)